MYKAKCTSIAIGNSLLQAYDTDLNVTYVVMFLWYKVLVCDCIQHLSCCWWKKCENCVWFCGL